MQNGGRREGAGRPKGSGNRAIAAALREEILAGGESPLEFLMGLMWNDQEEKAVRIDAAKAAAPYLHAKLANIAVGGDAENPLKMVIEWENVTE